MTLRLRWRTMALNVPFIAFIAFGRWCVDKGIVQLLHQCFTLHLLLETVSQTRGKLPDYD